MQKPETTNPFGIRKLLLAILEKRNTILNLELANIVDLDTNNLGLRHQALERVIHELGLLRAALSRCFHLQLLSQSLERLYESI